jgi:hypothetical protein
MLKSTLYSRFLADVELNSIYFSTRHRGSGEREKCNAPHEDNLQLE